MFQLASTIPDKEILLSQSQNHQVLLKTQPEYNWNWKSMKIADFISYFFLLNVRSRELCYGCMETILFYNIHFLHLQNNTVCPEKRFTVELI